MASCTTLFGVALAIVCAAPLAGQSGIERLTLVGPGNDVIAVIAGDGARVVIDPQIDELLRNPAAQMTLVHNHPHGVGLSVDDLLQLAKPGVAAIVALGVEGSRYEAARGARYDDDRFENVQYRAAHDQVLKSLLTARSHEPVLPTFDDDIAHLTSLALHKAGVLRYRAALGRERASRWKTYRPLLGPITEAAAARVRESAAEAR